MPGELTPLRFKAALGADVLEMDVYQAADNELVTLHDLDVDRTTIGTGDVVDLTLEELLGTPADRCSCAE